MVHYIRRTLVDKMREKMNIVTTLKQKTGYIVASAALVLGVIAPGLISVYVSAAQVTTRSIELSSSSISATGVTYDVKFTVPASGAGTAGAFAIEFCSNSADPLVTCVAPAGFTSAGVGVDASTPDFTATGTTNKVVVTGDSSASEVVHATLTGITNPSVAAPLYARIATFVDTAAATTGTAKLDEGSVVIGITNTIAVSGAVLETLTFCVANLAISPDCANAAANLPVLKIGEGAGNLVALNPGFISTGTLYTQLTTNAATGAVVNLKSATDCGGMKRAGAAACDIVPALNNGLTAGVAAFGVKTGTATGGTGVLQPAGGSIYNDTTYAFNYNADNSNGVTSTFGDPFLDTDSKPVNNQNMQLTFGASVSNSTPAGTYQTSLSMIATGKF